MYPDLQREEFNDGDPLRVYRLVTTGDAGDRESLTECLKSNRALGLEPRYREIEVPEIHSGLSVYRSSEHIFEAYRRLKAKLEKNAGGPIEVKKGHFAAGLWLEPGTGVMVEDLGERTGHLTIWSDPLHLFEQIAVILDVEQEVEAE